MRFPLCCGLLTLLLAIAHHAHGEELGPGLHKDLPSDGMPERTFSINIPGAYASTTRALPVLFFSEPGGNPKIYLFNYWATRNDVIVVGINSSKNGPADNNVIAQDACYKTLKRMGVRMHPCLKFAAGFSGGSQASWMFASRYPNEFAGLLMCAQAGIESMKLPKHIAVGYVHGAEEIGNPAIANMIQVLTRSGNPVREIIVPGAHVMGGAKQHDQLLDWMLMLGRMSHPGLSADDIAYANQLIQMQMTRAASRATPAEAEKDLRQLLDIPNIEKRPLYAQLLASWQTTALASATSASTPALRHALLVDLSMNPRFATAPNGKQILAMMAELRKDPIVSKEWEAHQMLLKVIAEETAAGPNANAVRLKTIADYYRELARLRPGTIAAERALAAAERLTPPPPPKPPTPPKP